LIEKDVVIVDKRTKDKIENEIVTHIEVGFDITHIVECFYEVKFNKLDKFNNQNEDYILKILLMATKAKIR